jgi:2',3'-cyclic-nucleotide 2'-phosphodiesterase (5'-nucleotidase family)
MRERAMKMRIFALLLVGAMLVAGVSVPAADEVTVTFYHTSDLHEHSTKLARIARYVKEQRTARGNVIFLDTGDWCNKGDLTELNTRGEAIAEAMGGCKYDVVIAGNHDYSHGTKRLAELVEKHSLPLTATNCEWPQGMKPKNFATHRIFKLKGVTVGVIGTATPIRSQAIDNLLKINDLFGSVGKAVAELEKSVDIVVVMTHIGWKEDPKLANSAAGIDLIFGGHSHKKYDKLNLNKKTGTVIQHSGFFGDQVGEVVIKWDGTKIIDRKVRLVKIDASMPEDEGVKAILGKYLSREK